MPKKYKKYIREVPDWPQKGILFKDITPLLQNSISFKTAVDELVGTFQNRQIDKILGIDARGFIFASAVAYKLKKAMIIARKPGKLPSKTVSEKYNLEYGTGELQMHVDSIKPGEKVLIIDDVLATGGTSLAAAKLVEKLGGIVVGISFLIELGELNGKSLLSKYNIKSLVKY